MITFVTGNKNKLQEVQSLLGPDIGSRALDLEEIQGTYQQIATHKARAAVAAIGGPVIVEDTGLEFVDWKELPGPYIKWFLRDLGVDKMHRLLSSFEKTANAVCTVAYCGGPDQDVHIFQGKTKGIIVEPRGPRDFGWDCCFQPDEYDQTYAELTKDLKNQISHRGKAMKQLKEFLKSST